MNIENIKVVLTKHAMLDCIPLRFGKLLTNKYGYLQGQLDEKETKWQKPVELRKGNKHYIGDFFQAIVIETRPPPSRIFVTK